MSRSTNKHWYVCVFLLVFGASMEAKACEIGCIKAEAAGLPELADALNHWANLLPRLNEEFHKEVRADLRQMDLIALNLVEQLSRKYGEQLDATSDEVKHLMMFAVAQINKVGQVAVDRYREALWETECTSEALAQNFINKFENITPSFAWIKQMFGYGQTLRIEGFGGEIIEEEFAADSASSKLVAEFKLLRRKLETANDDTQMLAVMNTSTDLQIAAFKNHCQTRASIGRAKFGHFYEMWLEARDQYSDLNFVYQSQIGR